MIWKVKRRRLALGALQKAHSSVSGSTSDRRTQGVNGLCVFVCVSALCTCVLLHRCTRVCVYLCICVYLCARGCVRRQGRPIKKLPEERAFSWESMGGREDGRAIVCHSSILRAGIRGFLLCSTGRLCTTTDPMFN